MPKTTSQRVVFTLIGVILMSTTMAFFNKYRVYGAFSPKLLQEVLIACCQKGPLAFVLQFFFVQKFAGKQTEKYKTDNVLLNNCIRVGFTVIWMCPIMCLYSNIINMIQFHWSFAMLLEAWITKMPVNWAFAYGVQVFLLKPLTVTLFGLICPKAPAHP